MVLLFLRMFCADWRVEWSRRSCPNSFGFFTFDDLILSLPSHQLVRLFPWLRHELQ